MQSKNVLKEGIILNNRVKNMKSLSKDSIKEEITNNTKKFLESIGR